MGRELLKLIDDERGLQQLLDEQAQRAARAVFKLIQSGESGPLPPDPEYYSPRDAGAFLGLTPKSLEHMRQSGEGPRHIKWGKLVRYRLADLREWAERGAQE